MKRYSIIHLLDVTSRDVTSSAVLGELKRNVRNFDRYKSPLRGLGLRCPDLGDIIAIILDRDALFASSRVFHDSPALGELFGPTLQHLGLRRRNLVNKLPSNVKYVIDTAPPSEGEGTQCSLSVTTPGSRDICMEHDAL